MRIGEIINENIVAAGSDILVREPSEGSFHELYELYQESIDGLVQSYSEKSRPTYAPWRVVPASKLKSVWTSSARYGFVRMSKQLAEIANLFFNNTARLWANTDIAAHGEASTEEVLADHLENGHITEDDLGGFLDWCIDTPEGGWRISDYGLPKLIRLARLLKDCNTDEEVLMVCDAMLNVIHPRSDLASWFVQGGSMTLSEVSLQGLTESAEGSWVGSLDEKGLIDYAWESVHDDEADEIPEFIEEMFDGASAVLKRIPLGNLKLNGGVEVPERTAEYERLTTEAPPIIVNGSTKEIMDGNHRVRIARQRGEKDILAYVVAWDSEPF